MGEILTIRLTKDSELVTNDLEQMLEKLSRVDSKSIFSFESWQTNVNKLLNSCFNMSSISEQFNIRTKVMLNKFSESENQKNIKRAMDKAKVFLEELVSSINDGVYDDTTYQENSINTSTARIIVRRILRNFYKHLETMYQESVHGSGTIRKDDLDKISIGNEYDVQRILYSLIRPIFPETRLEKVDDAGYAYVRYDIVIEKYKIIIEVKCTRPSMRKRNLAEELGSDSFHYEGDYLFMFVYDKEKIISNVDAFETAYTKPREVAGKSIETIVVQQIKL